MDLSFPRPSAAGDAALPAADRALLTAVLAARPAVERDVLDADAAYAAPLAPAAGAFNAAMAVRLAAWKQA